MPTGGHSSSTHRGTAMDVVTSHNELYIGGEWVTPVGDEHIEVVSPVSEEVIATVPSGSQEDVDRAVAAARRALTFGAWPAMTVDERVALVVRLRDLLVEHSEELAQVITEEMGCPITQSRDDPGASTRSGSSTPTSTSRLRYPFREVRRSRNGQALVLREPVGVVAGVVPWNVPAVADHAEAGARPAHRLHHRAQARARDPAGRLPRGSTARRGRAARPASSTSCRPTATSASTSCPTPGSTR